MEERKMVVEVDIPVHSYDVDFMQIVSNTAYVKWLEDMRMAILDKYLPLTKLLEMDLSPILAETCIQYKYPVRIGCHPKGICKIWLKSRGRWVADFLVFEDERVYATAQQHGYMFNLQSKRPASFPDEIVEKYLIEE
ncbi:MAG: acyl-CoA thioesterase [Bacteroidales bacterium]|nr:acyl-CoA thioesterase [Bacteroidales bacterium]